MQVLPRRRERIHAIPRLILSTRREVQLSKQDGIGVARLAGGSAPVLLACDAPLCASDCGHSVVLTTPEGPPPATARSPASSGSRSRGRTWRASDPHCATGSAPSSYGERLSDGLAGDGPFAERFEFQFVPVPTTKPLTSELIVCC